MRPETELPDDPAQFAVLNLSMPRLTKFKNKAILSDLNALPARVDTRHRVGLNALYGDGSAGWVDRKRFDADLRPCTIIDVQFNPNQSNIWAAMDR
jgi:prepilin-type processing-associated H-X9-DG protein